MVFITSRRFLTFNQKIWLPRLLAHRLICKKLNAEEISIIIDPKVPYPMSDKGKNAALVTDVYRLSKSVRGMKLKIQDSGFSFKAGQWVDFFVPGLEKIAGYSMCTSPEYYKETSSIELAVKYSTYPPTKWVHDECTAGSVVDVAVGGQFYFDSDMYINDLESAEKSNPENQNRKGNLLLIAGGVGINPLVSILRHITRNNETLKDKVKVLLLYCASSEDELIFKDKICDLVSRHEHLSCEFLVTTTGPVTECTTCIASRIHFTTSQRLNEGSMSHRIGRYFGGVDNLTCYLCGPNEMIDELSGALHNIGVPENRVKFEKWW